MKWRDAALAGIRRLVERQGDAVFDRQTLIREELNRIVQATNSKGKTPDQTLSRILQGLRDEGIIEFVDDKGAYRLKEG